MPTKFGKTRVELSYYCIEYKHRPEDDNTGEREEIIDTRRIGVPVLKNRGWEDNWALTVAWNDLTKAENKARGINAAYVCTDDFKRTLTRLELNPFQDEESRVLNPPSDRDYHAWRRQIEQRFKQLYGISLKGWEEECNRHPVAQPS